MATGNAAASITIDACSRLLDATVKSCAPTHQPSPVPPPPNWDALATTFGSLSVVIGLFGLLLGIIAIVAGFAWAKIVKRDAEDEARKEAKACVDKMLGDWLATEAPQVVRRHVEYIVDASIDGDDDQEQAADAMGEGAG